MMIYLVLGALLAGSVFGFYGGYSWESGRWASAENERVEAQAKVDAQAREIEKQAANAITDMEAAYQAGEEKGRAAGTKVVYRATTNIARDSGLQDPVCKLNADSFALLTATLHGVRAGVTLPPEGSRETAPVPVAAPPRKATP